MCFDHLENKPQWITKTCAWMPWTKAPMTFFCVELAFLVCHCCGKAEIHSHTCSEPPWPLRTRGEEKGRQRSKPGGHRHYREISKPTWSALTALCPLQKNLVWGSVLLHHRHRQGSKLHSCIALLPLGDTGRPSFSYQMAPCLTAQLRSPALWWV